MKKKREPKKLTLGKETLTHLERKVLDRVAGAGDAIEDSGTTCSGVYCSQYWTQCFCS